MALNRAVAAVRVRAGPATVTRARRRSSRSPRRVAGLDVRALDPLRADLERRAGAAAPRWNADPEEVRRSVAKLVLTLVEFLRQLFERQAIRRMEGGTLTSRETESIGVALMRLEETITDLAARFGLRPEELNLDLGPLGKLSGPVRPAAGSRGEPRPRRRSPPLKRKSRPKI